MREETRMIKVKHRLYCGARDIVWMGTTHVGRRARIERAKGLLRSDSLREYVVISQIVRVVKRDITPIVIEMVE